MKLIKAIAEKLGYVKKSDIAHQLHYARSVGKRLDEHRETVEAIASKTTLLKDFWHIGHLSTQDDYLMRLYFIVYGQWPSDKTALQKTGEHVRPRPAILGPCGLPEFTN